MMNFKSFFYKEPIVEVGENYNQYLENCQLRPKDCPGLFLRHLWQGIFGDVLQSLELDALEVVLWILLPTILLLFIYFKKSIMDIWYIIQTNRLEVEALALELEILNNKLYYYYNDDYWDIKNELKSSTRTPTKLSNLESEISKSRILKIKQGDFECCENMVKKEFLEEKSHRELLDMMQEYERDFNTTFGNKNVTIQKQDRNEEFKKHFNGVAMKSTSAIDNISLAEMSTKMNVSRTNENRAQINGKTIKLSPCLKQLDNTKYPSKKWQSAFACNRILPIERSISNIEVASKGNPPFNLNKIVSMDNSNLNTRNCGDMEINNCLIQKIIMLLNKGESEREFDKSTLQSGSDENEDKGAVAKIKSCSFIENNQELIQQPNNKGKRIRHRNHLLPSLAEETYCDLAKDSHYQEEEFFDNQSAYPLWINDF